MICILHDIVARDAVFICLDDWFDDAFDKSHLTSNSSPCLNLQTLDLFSTLAILHSNLAWNVAHEYICAWKKEGATI